ncbi:hypothetical protein [Microbacterium maritypicum]
MAEPHQLTASVQWAYDPTAVPAPVNQFMFQGGLNLANGTPSTEVYMMFGHTTPPPIDPASIPQEVIDNGLILNVVPVGQYSISLARLRELHSTLGDFLATAPFTD